MGFQTLAAESGYLLDGDSIVGIVAIAGGLTFAAVIGVAGMLTTARKVRQREETRREIAAYVAEGSISPEDAERLLAAGRDAEEAKNCGCM